MSEIKIQVAKCWTNFFQDVASGKKTFEVRKDDRGYRVGQELHLLEYDPSRDEYTGKKCEFRIVYKLDGGQWGIEPGYCVLGIGDLV